MNLAILGALLAALALPAAAAPAAQPFSITLEPGKSHEECLKLDKGDRRRYEWKADAPLAFNIHYHEGSEVFYPVKRDGQRRSSGTFRAKIAQEYCWMWTAKIGAKLEGSIR